MMRTAVLALSLLLTPMLSAQPSQPPGSAPLTAEDTLALAADRAFQPIKRDLKNLSESLRNLGGLREEHHAMLQKLRDRAAEFSQQFPDDPRGLAVELQIATWLGEDELVDSLYAKAARTWPNDPKLRLAWIQRLKSQNRYSEALEALEQQPIDAAEHPELAMEHSEVLFAEHRFQQAIDALNAIPESTFDVRPELRFQVEQARSQREPYVDFWVKEQELRSQEDAADDLPRAVLVTPRGSVMLELFENQAPNTVANFISLAEQGFYSGTKFHRVIPGFMAQGGDPNTKPGNTGAPGQGDPGYYIADEVSGDYRRHFSGSLAMAKSAAPDSGGSQFYLTVAPTPWLNGQHTVFGRVIQGLDVVRTIEQDDVIDSVTIIRKRDHEYVPQTIPIPGRAAAPQPAPAADTTGGEAAATQPDAPADETPATTPAEPEQLEPPAAPPGSGE